MISVHFQSKSFNITIIQVYAPTTNTKEAEVEQFYEDLQDLLELKPKNDVLLIIGNWNAKIGSQEIPEITGKFGLGVQNEAGQKLTEFCQENVPVIANTLFQQHKRQLYTWTSPDGQNQIDYILCSQRWRTSIQSAKTRQGADCGSDHEFLIAKFRLWEDPTCREATKLMLQPLSLCSRGREPQLLSPRAAATEDCMLSSLCSATREAPTMRSSHTATRV